MTIRTNQTEWKARPGASNAGQARVRRDRMPAASLKRHFGPEEVGLRRRWLNAVTGSHSNELFRGHLNAEACAGNIENFIGTLQVPVGIAGPLHVIGAGIDDHVPLPLATTEGALVRSLHRGALICNLAGGIQVHARGQRISRAPVFVCQSFGQALELERWIDEHKDQIRHQAEACSGHARLLQLETVVFDRTVHVEFAFSTRDAAGQNMVTACTWGACEWIKQQLELDPSLGFERYQIEGNLSADKKLSGRSLTLGRGHAVTARCVIPERLLKRFFGVDASTFLDAYQVAQAGAAHAGLAAFNVNFANAIAGIFLACGQDVASVHEASGGFFQVTPADGGIAIAAHLPSLPVGSVGGGTGLPTQAECLSLVGCQGSGGAVRLAAIVAAACLALDLSTGGAIAGGQFASAHQRLGRNPPPASSTQDDVARLVGIDPESLNRFEQSPLDSTDDVMCRIRSRVGGGSLSRCRMHVQGEQQPRVAVVKHSVPVDGTGPLAQCLATIAGDDSLTGLLEGGLDSLDLGGSAGREWAFYRHADTAYRAYMPEALGLSEPASGNHPSPAYTIALEDLEGCRHLAPGQPWTREEMHITLTAMARFHALGWQHRPAWMDRVREPEDKACHAVGRELRHRLLARAIDSSEITLPAAVHAWLISENQAADCASDVRFRTVIHNDLSTRNICLRSTKQGLEPVFYDWEFVTWGAPQRDVIEFLTHVLAPTHFQAGFEDGVRHYHDALTEVLPDAPSQWAFRRELMSVAGELFLSRTVPLALLREALGLAWFPPVLANMGSLLQSGIVLERAA